MGDPLAGAMNELQLDQTSKADPVTKTYMPSTEPKANTYMPKADPVTKTFMPSTEPKINTHEPKADPVTKTYMPSTEPKVNTYMPKAGLLDTPTSRSKQKAPEDELKKLWQHQGARKFNLTHLKCA